MSGIPLVFFLDLLQKKDVEREREPSFERELSRRRRRERAKK